MMLVGLGRREAAPWAELTPRSGALDSQEVKPATGELIKMCSLRRPHAGRTVTVHVAETTLAIDLDDETKVVRRTNSNPVRSIKGQRPRTAMTSVS
jgi:hypothetical protein